MKIAKWIGIALAGYVGVVVLFESLIGFFQPQSDNTLVITTRDDAGQTSDRVVTSLPVGDQLYVAANHWPRAWYTEAVANPDVQIVLGGEASERRAVSVTGAEHDGVDAAHPLPAVFRVLTGFPPRLFLRLDPR